MMLQCHLLILCVDNSHYMIVAASVSIIESFLLIVLEHITSKRDYIPGVTAIYFVEPSDRNVALIINVLTLLTLLWN